MSGLAEIIDGLEDAVRLQKELGRNSEEISPDVWAAFAAPQRAPALLAQPAARPAEAPRAAAGGGRAIGADARAAVADAPVSAKTHGERETALAEIAAKIEACSACDLRAGRTKAVPGQGNPDSPDVMFIGEAPGADEDRQGLAFVGAAGHFLTKMIEAMGYTRDQVFIANICKCRPPGNRTPTPDEMRICFPFLREQIRIVRPKSIVLLGGTAIKAILNTQTGVMRMQGQWSKYGNIPVMPTYHPAYVLRFERMGQPAETRKVKLAVWTALKKVLALLGKTPPPIKK